ncbi:MAG: GNAT family protein [Pseudomonadota bacterium]
MTHDLNNWTARERPPYTAVEGRYVTLVPIVDDTYFDDLWNAFTVEGSDVVWSYLLDGPFAEKSAFLDYARHLYLGKDPMFHALIDAQDGKAKGVASLMRINPEHGSIEVGHICYGLELQRRPATTEAFYLFGKRVFEELGYRRFEWKCNNLNEPSKRAAIRFGYVPEGVHRQAMIAKGKNRDTAWFSILDSEWPGLKNAFEQWLSPDNFDSQGQQNKRLEEFRN